MYLKQILKFESIKQLPESFLCNVCVEVCRLPIVQDSKDYLSLFDYCDDEIKVIFNGLSSYLQFLICYDCHYCGKNINYWNSANHQMKCEDIVVTLSDMMAHFELITSQEVEKCLNCNQIPFKPKQYQGKVVCMFCQHQNSLEKLDELSEEQNKTYENLQTRCKQCSEILNLQQTFLHFKKCLFNRKYYKIRKFETYYYVKWLRKQQKESHKVFNINLREHVIGIQNEKKLNLEINKSQTEERSITRKLNYLKQLRIK
ncbi:hypothetical protein pb186bvf_009928 [Paramecium bursaria]